MAFKHGRTTRVFYGGVELSPYLRSAELTVTAETADTTTYGGDGWRTAIAGLIAAGYEFEGLYDPAETGIQAAFATDTVLTVCPSGATLGDPARLVPVLSTSYGQSSPVDDAVGISWGVEADDALAFGKVYHALSEDTNTTTSSSIDDSAATSTGWTVHGHVTLVDGGSWVIKLEDSANNSAWADVTGGASAAITTAGAFRLTSAASTTALRRYVRITATRTGGSAGQGITYLLSIARSNM